MAEKLVVNQIGIGLGILESSRYQTRRCCSEGSALHSVRYQLCCKEQILVGPVQPAWRSADRDPWPCLYRHICQESLAPVALKKGRAMRASSPPPVGQLPIGIDRPPASGFWEASSQTTTGSWIINQRTALAFGAATPWTHDLNLTSTQLPHQHTLSRSAYKGKEHNELIRRSRGPESQKREGQLH